MIGSDLETLNGLATKDLEEMIDSNVSEKTNIIIQTGGATKWHNNICQDGKVQRFSIKGGKIYELENLGKVNMVDGNTLQSFIEFAAANYPSNKNVLVLWNHGGSIPVSYGKDENFPGKYMNAYEIGEAVKGSKVHFETIAFDACNTCTLEMAMALKDYCDYMVAAESYVNGNGYYYTEWLKTLDKSKPHEIDYTEQICTDYMDSIHRDNLTGSISVLQAKKIGAIYQAYVDYMKVVKANVIDGGDYANYTLARSNSDSYPNMDTVDVLTLASLYKNDYSTKLMNAVVNSVEHTDSDFAAGHGIAVYCPFDFIEDYSNARKMLQKLGYDNDLLEFYDSYCSLKLAYQGQVAVSDQGGDWYDDSVGDTVDDSQVAQTYTLGTTTNSSGQTIVDMNSDTMAIIQKTEMTVALISDDQTKAVMLGSDNTFRVDADGNFLYEKPECWTTLNGIAATYISSSYYHATDSDYWEQEAVMYAKVNGKDAFILVFCNPDNPYGKMQGYAYADGFDENAIESYYAFDDEDTIDIVYIMMDINSEKISYEANGEPVKYKDAVLSYETVDLSGYNVMIGYQFEDVYGNVYKAEYQMAQ